MTIHSWDRNGRPVVRLGWLDRAVLGAAGAAALSVIGWMGLQLVDMRDSLKAQVIYHSQTRRDLDDHELRLRWLEGKRP